MKLMLRQKFILWFSGILIGLFLLVFLTVRLIIYNVFEKPVFDRTFAAQAETDNVIAEVFNNVTHLYSEIIIEAGGVIERIADEATDEAEAKTLFSDILNRLSYDKTLFYNITLKAGGRILYSNADADSTKTEFFNVLKENSASIPIDSNVSGCIVAGKQAKGWGIDLDQTSALVFYLREEAVSKYLALMTQNTGAAAMLVTESHYIFSSTRASYTGTAIFDKDSLPLKDAPYYDIKDINGVKSIVIISKAQEVLRRYKSNWYIVNIIPYDETLAPFLTLEYVIVALAFAILALAAFIAAVLAKRITKPLVRLSSTIEEVIRTGEKRQLSESGTRGDEIAQLEKSYDDMINRIFALLEKTKEDMEIQRKLELDALQMGMNTHFLFNTLDAVGWLAKIKKQPEIESLVLNLAKFFRLSLHSGDKFVRVADEVEIIRHFIEIERICYPDKFTVEYRVREEVSAYMTLKLILQPVVENAVKHGLSELENGGKIAIDIYGEGDNIIYEVTDNGIGFNVDDFLNKPKSSSYGLKNVNERIKLEYGEGYGITLSSKIGEGTKTKIVIPKIL